MDNGVPEGAQRLNGEAVSYSRADILRGRTTMPGGTRRAADTAEIGEARQAGEADGVRPLRREPGQSHPAGRRMDVPP